MCWKERLPDEMLRDEHGLYVQCYKCKSKWYYPMCGCGKERRNTIVDGVWHSKNRCAQIVIVEGGKG